jgi:hypothetical protein
VTKHLRFAIVWTLEKSCGLFHPVTHHRPWPLLPVRNNWCLPATWSAALDERWGTGVWTKP